MQGYRGEASEKIQLADKLKPLLAVIPDLRLRDLYLTEVAQKMNVSLSWLKQSLGAVSSSYGPSPIKPTQTMTLRPTQNSQELTRTQEPNVVPSVSSSQEEAKIILKGASKAEVLLIGLVLKSRANFEAFVNEKIIESVAHDGVKKILEKSTDVYRQDLNKFDKLTSLLVSYVDQPELLFLADNISRQDAKSGEDSFDEDAEKKLLRDCFKRVREIFLREQAKNLAREMKAEPSSEKMEQMMNIQRDRISLNKGNRR